MQLMHFGSAAMVAALAVALAPSAQAQDVPFGTLNSGPVAPMSLQAQNTVVRSQAELDSTGLSQLMPRAALVRIDWDKEMLIAVVMGPQRSGGHGISVEAINWRITPFGGGPGAPLGGAQLGIPAGISCDGGGDPRLQRLWLDLGSTPVAARRDLVAAVVTTLVGHWLTPSVVPHSNT